MIIEKYLLIKDKIKVRNIRNINNINKKNIILLIRKITI